MYASNLEPNVNGLTDYILSIIIGGAASLVCFLSYKIVVYFYGMYTHTVVLIQTLLINHKNGNTRNNAS